MNMKYCTECFHRVDERTYTCTKCRMDFSEVTFVLDNERLQEKIRKHKAPMKTMGMVSIILLVILFISFSIIVNDDIQIEELNILAVGVLYLGGILFFIIVIAAGNKIVGFKKLTKQLIMETVIGRYFTQFSYSPNGGEMVKMLPQLKLAEKFNRQHTVHELKAAYRNVNFMLGDLDLSIYRDEKTDKPVFNGSWLTVEMAKSVSWPILITSAANALKWNFPKNSAVATEDVVFNSRFKVMAEDGLYAFKILTPAMMETMLHSDHLKGCPVHFIFNGNKAHVLIQTGKAMAQSNLMDKKVKFSVTAIDQHLMFILQMIDLLMNNKYFFK